VRLGHLLSGQGDAAGARAAYQQAADSGHAQAAASAKRLLDALGTRLPPRGQDPAACEPPSSHRLSACTSSNPVTAPLDRPRSVSHRSRRHRPAAATTASHQLMNPVTAGYHTGDVKDGQHAPNAEYARSGLVVSRSRTWAQMSRFCAMPLCW
jgi:hypothetical protein